jgi:hypothetical protein
MLIDDFIAAKRHACSDRALLPNDTSHSPQYEPKKTARLPIAGVLDLKYDLSTEKIVQPHVVASHGRRVSRCSAMHRVCILAR